MEKVPKKKAAFLKKKKKNSLLKKVKKIISLILILPVIFILCIGVVAYYQSYKMALAFNSKQQYQESSYDGSGNIVLSQQVESYRMIVYQYASTYGIADYTNLLLAVMMQESGGRGNDVFQAAESLGIASYSMTVEMSIEQGVKVMAERLSACSVISPSDILNIKTALQGYNYGGGYITYALSIDGKWTQENANEFARQQSHGVQRSSAKANRLGIWAYGDQFYTDHVLRYYNYKIVNVANNEIIGLAEEQIGKPYVWAAAGPDSFDCSGLVYYVYSQLGIYNGSRTSAEGFKAITTEISESKAVAGDLVFFTNTAGVVHHIGIYAGEGKMIHSPQPGQTVKYANVARNNGDKISYGRFPNMDNMEVDNSEK